MMSAAIAPDAAPSRLRSPPVQFLARHWTSIALLAALLSALTLHSIRWPWGVRVSGSVVASAVTLRLDEDLDAELELRLQPAEVHVTGTSWVRPPIDLGSERPASSAEISAAELGFSELQLGRGSMLTLERESSGEILLLAGGAGGALKFAATGPFAMKLPDTTFKSDDKIAGMEMSVGTQIDSSEQLVLRARTSDALALDDLPISLIRFGRARQVGKGFVSSIVSGAFRLVDVNDAETLEPSAALQIQEFHGEMLRLEGVEGGYRVSFTGQASRVQLGPPGFAEEKTPSILMFLYHQESIQMMWVSAFAMLAAIAKVRSWIVGKRDD